MLNAQKGVTGNGMNYKKSELMLMRRARAHISLCSQVILVYLHPFHCNLRLCSKKSQKNHQKPLFLELKVNHSHQYWQS